MRRTALSALSLALVASGCAGAGEGAVVPPAGSPRASVAAPTERVAVSACQPGFDAGLERQPWQGDRRRRSEQTFQRRIAREHPAYVSGRDGWKFFTDVQDRNFSQAVGRVTLSERNQQAWVRWIRRSQRVVERRGGRYFVVVAPANWDVYADQLPAWARRLRGTTSLQRIIREHPELPWIDTRRALRTASHTHDTYEALNSHWTPYGGHVAWAAITRCVRAQAGARFDAVAAPPVTGVSLGPSANEFRPNGVPDGPPARTFPVYADAHPETTVTRLTTGEPVPNRPDHSTGTDGTPLRTETPQAQAPGLTLLTLRDSMSDSLSPLWSWSFGTTVQYAHGINQMGYSPPDLSRLVADHRPDLVLLVITERWLTRRPPA